MYLLFSRKAEGNGIYAWSALNSLYILLLMWFTKGGMVGGPLVKDPEVPQTIP